MLEINTINYSIISIMLIEIFSQAQVLFPSISSVNLRKLCRVDQNKTLCI